MFFCVVLWVFGGFLFFFEFLADVSRVLWVFLGVFGWFFVFLGLFCRLFRAFCRFLSGFVGRFRGFVS